MIELHWSKLNWIEGENFNFRKKYGETVSEICCACNERLQCWLLINKSIIIDLRIVFFFCSSSVLISLFGSSAVCTWLKSFVTFSVEWWTTCTDSRPASRPSSSTFSDDIRLSSSGSSLYIELSASVQHKDNVEITHTNKLKTHLGLCYLFTCSYCIWCMISLWLIESSTIGYLSNS